MLQGTSALPYVHFLMFLSKRLPSDLIMPTLDILDSPSRLACRWTLGSALFLASFAAVMGPMAYVQHLLSGPRLPFTGAYFGSIIMTFIFALKVSHSVPFGLSLFKLCAAARASPVNTCLHQRVQTDTMLSRVVTQHIPHLDLSCHTDSLPIMVPSQLLSHGVQRVADSHHLRR